MTEDEYISLELAKTRIEAAANNLRDNKIISAWENIIRAGSCLEQVMKKAKIEREQEPKKGHWIEVIDEIDSLGNKTWHYKCSICGNEDSSCEYYKYCPNCGAKMQEVEE